MIPVTARDRPQNRCPGVCAYRFSTLWVLFADPLW